MPNSSSGILSPVDIIKCIFKESSIVLPWEYQIVVLPYPSVSTFNTDFYLKPIIYFMQIMDYNQHKEVRNFTIAPFLVSVWLTL